MASKPNSGYVPKSTWPTMMDIALPLCASCLRSCWRIGNASKGHGMSSSVNPTRVRFDEDSMWVDLSDGRIIGVPLAWFPRLLHGTPEQRDQVRISSRGLHWDDLDEDIAVQGLLAGLGDQSTPNKTFAA